MAIKITENGVVRYENEPNVDRLLFPNTSDCSGCSEQISELKENLTELQELVDTKAPAIYVTASGTIVSFSDGADDMPIKSCVVKIEPIQEGEGDPSLENVRPINGHTGLTVSHSGSDTSDPTTISVNWESEVGTVYGGTLDIVSGKLLVDRAKITFDGTQTIGTSNWRPYDDSSAWLYSPEITPGIYNVINAREMCDKLKSIPYEGGAGGIYSNNIGIGVVGTSDYAIGMRVPVSGLTTATLINAWLAENPITVIYKLATPTEIQLTSQEIVRTLLGENSIWSDGGGVTVEYPADTKMYIENLTAPTEYDMVADHAISANSFFMVANTLYRATTNIANGATITVGTNAVKLSLSDALNELA